MYGPIELVDPVATECALGNGPLVNLIQHDRRVLGESQRNNPLGAADWAKGHGQRSARRVRVSA
jgi:hypothetical protein